MQKLTERAQICGLTVEDTAQEAIRTGLKNKFRPRRREKAPADYLTVKATAELLGVSVRTIHRYINTRGLPASKPAGRWIINRKELEQWTMNA